MDSWLNKFYSTKMHIAHRHMKNHIDYLMNLHKSKDLKDMQVSIFVSDYQQIAQTLHNQINKPYYTNTNHNHIFLDIYTCYY